MIKKLIKAAFEGRSVENFAAEDVNEAAVKAIKATLKNPESLQIHNHYSENFLCFNI